MKKVRPARLLPLKSKHSLLEQPRDHPNDFPTSRILLAFEVSAKSLIYEQLNVRERHLV